MAQASLRWQDVTLLVVRDKLSIYVESSLSQLNEYAAYF
jgi:hypothetical protein